MKLPAEKDYRDEYHLGDETYSYKIVNRFPVKGKGIVGLCCPADHKIWMRKRQTKVQLFRTFCHETLHGIDSEYQIGLTHEQVYKLEAAIVDFLLRNF